MKRDFFDFDSEYYKPLWIRILILAICFGWGMFEFANGNTLWATVFFGAGVFALWGFFIRRGDDE